MNINIMDYVKPELLIVIAVIWGIGLALKASKTTNRFIPVWLCLIAVGIALLWVVATSPFYTPQEIAMGIFIAVTQGVVLFLVAWLTYDKMIKKGLEENNGGKG